MKFSVIFSFVAPPGSTTRHIDTFREFTRVVPLIESLGYHGVHVTEHHFQRDGFLPSPLMVLAHASALTKRVKLATNILVSSLYEPMQLLEDLATLDNLSEGRVILGTSPGYASEEFAGRGLVYDERFKRHEEILDFLQHAWRNPDNIAFDGSIFKVPAVQLSPTPIQAELPIWYGVSGPKLLQKTGKRAVPLTASPRHTVEELKGHYAQYLAAAAEVGYTPTDWPIFREGLVLETTEEAEKYGIPGTNALFGIYGRKSAEGERALHLDGGDLVTDQAMVDFRALKSRYIVGDVALAKERLHELKRELNPTEIVLRMQMPGLPTDVLERSLRLIAEKVMPDFA